MTGAARGWRGLGGSFTALAIILAFSSASAFGLYKLYDFLFPFKEAAAHGVCMYCGAATKLGPSGWADFCPRHESLFAMVPAAIVTGETFSLFAAALSLWMFLRLLSQRKGSRISLWIAILLASAVAISGLLAGETQRFLAYFAIALVILFYILTAIYVDSIESMILAMAWALALAALLAGIIKLVLILLTGYLGFFA